MNKSNRKYKQTKQKTQKAKNKNKTKQTKQNKNKARYHKKIMIWSEIVSQVPMSRKHLDFN